MEIQKPKMIAFDLDGTLLRDDKTISDYTLNILDECQKQGIKIIFATGRAYMGVKDYEKLVKPCGFVINNGAKVIYNKELLAVNAVNPGDADRLIKKLFTIDDMYLTINYGEISYTNDPVFKSFTYFNGVFTDFKEYSLENILNITTHTVNYREVEALDCKEYNCNFYPSVFEPSFCVFIHEMASKLNGIATICRQLDIDVKDVVAFGDELNDLEMLRGCGTGVAVSNACEQAKKAAAQLCDTNENDGAAKWIEKHILS